MKTRKPKIGIIAVARTTFDIPFAEEILDRAWQNLENLDIEIIASFLVRPEFSKQDFKDFAQYCRNLKLFPVLFSTLTPLPGTDLYDEVKSRLITTNYDHFDLAHTVLPTSLKTLTGFSLNGSFRGTFSVS